MVGCMTRPWISIVRFSQYAAFASALAVVAIGCDQNADPTSDTQPNVTDAPEAANSSPAGTADHAAAPSSPQDTAGNAASNGTPSTAPATSSASSSDGADAEASGESDIPLERLLGTWRAEGVDAPMGNVNITLDFQEDGQVHLEANSTLPFVGEVRDKVRSFELRNGKIHVPNLRDGVTMPLSFRGEDTLILEYKQGERVEFRRVQ